MEQPEPPAVAGAPIACGSGSEGGRVVNLAGISDCSVTTHNSPDGLALEMGFDGEAGGDVFRKGRVATLGFDRFRLTSFGTVGIEHAVDFRLEALFHVLAELTTEVLGFGKLPLHLISGRFHGAEEQGFQFAQVVISDG